MDIIGIGALNIDYIKAMPWTLSNSNLRALHQNFQPGREEWVSNENIIQHIHEIGTTEFDYMGPGGSAFNTIRCIAQMNLGFSLGYIGIAGAPSSECDLRSHITKNAIDSTYVFDSKHPTGKCISLYWPGERARGLRTSPGVDKELEVKLADPKLQEDIVHYLAKARWVHLTSFINQDVLAQVTQILKRAKRENSSLTISFDPGSEYCRNLTSQVKEAIRLSDYLFLNWDEFCQLSDFKNTRKAKMGKQSEKELAMHIFNTLQCNNATIIVKSSRSIRFFQSFQGKIISRRYWQVPLLPPSIVDDTGAGDVFAAGFIGTSLIPALGFDMKTIMLLCTRLVKAKLGFTGCDGEKIYEQIVQQVLNEIQRKESTNISNVGRTYLSEIGSFLLGVFSSSFMQFLISRLIK